MAKDEVKQKAGKPPKKHSAFISLEDKEALSTKKAKTPYSERRAIVYFSHLPHGFEEKQLRQYLGQFGNITNLRLGRSKKTGGSKGYAFVEFKYPEVAKIVVDTMNNYLMFDRLVKCEVVPAERMSKACFKGKVNPDNPPLKVARFKAKKEVNALRTEEQNNARLRKQLRKLEKVKEKLESAGMKVNLQFDKGAAGSKQPAKGTPLMEVDTEDGEVRMKTPRNVRKVKNRLSKDRISPKRRLAAEDMESEDLLMQQLAQKLKTEKKASPKRLQQSLSTPKSSRVEASNKAAATPKKPSTPKSGKKFTPKGNKSSSVSHKSGQK